MKNKDGTNTISRKDITIDSSRTTNIKASKNVVVKGQKILQNQCRVTELNGYTEYATTFNVGITRVDTETANVSRECMSCHWGNLG